MSDPRRAKFRELLGRRGVTLVPGAHDALTARLIEAKGFEAVYMTGGGTSVALTGLPDNGLVTASETVMNARYIADSVSIPLIVDADTGYGNAVNAVRTIRDLDRAGAACVQIEDQVSPKRCGHLPGKEVVSRAEFVGKIRAVADHRPDPALAIMARTDARATFGFEEAVVRGNEALKAGADLVFIEALESAEEFAEYARRCPGPLLANMTEFGKTPLIPAEEFGRMGYRFVIFPASALRVMLRAAAELLDEIREKGTQAAYLDRMMTRAELYDLIDYDAYHRIEARYLPRD
ncbi:MAG: isocitrate lyase/phosphoenolpyruvate mutase family protein [Candidatus Tectomicrobia bacterium]|uniref:2-methylisocitrate lyase n=1 Tax=Tectimicrobiota bacterium TaxID=2528274 RepID=A0A932MR59_UNCTE|nr:isocitrate lyase/phosphoenolpyruvate mutase family protein [Candidatus Tectomicrobia bacterium]